MTRNYYLDDKRLRTSRGRLFQLLADGEWHTAKDLARVGGISFHTSLNRFRAAGWQINSERIGTSWRYRLKGRGTPRTRVGWYSQKQQRVVEEYARAVQSALGPEARRAMVDALPLWIRREHERAEKKR